MLQYIYDRFLRVSGHFVFVFIRSIFLFVIWKHLLNALFNVSMSVLKEDEAQRLKMGLFNVFCIFNFLFDAESLMYRLQLRQTANVFRNVQGSLVCKLASAVWILRFQIRGAEVIH